MRKIKFRAWYEDKIVEVKSLMSGDYIVIPLRRYPFVQTVICKDIMQYTEVNDFENNEIFEGDVLNSIGGTELTYYVVKYNNGGFYLFNKWGRWGTLDRMKEMEKYHDLNFVVIGNIYENPDLNIFEKNKDERRQI